MALPDVDSECCDVIACRFPLDKAVPGGESIEIAAHIADAPSGNYTSHF